MVAPYAPVYFPGEKLPRTTSATVTAGQVLVVSGSDTVAASAAASSAWLGIAANSAASGGPVTVYAQGVHDLTASGAITAGDPVISAAAGAVATGASATNYAQVLGVALTTATNGNPVRVRLR